MKKIFQIMSISFLLLQIFIMEACAPKIVKMDPTNVQLLKSGVKVWSIHNEAPEFIINSTSNLVISSIFAGIAGGAGNSAVGAASIGAASATAGGTGLNQQGPLEDPAPKIKENFMTSMSEKLGLEEVQNVVDVVPNSTMKEWKRTHRDGFLFGFRTINWVIEPYPTALRYYRLIFWHQGQLTRLSDDQIIWNGVCKYEEQEPKEKWPKLKELMADNADLIRVKVNQAGDYCIQKLLQQFFGDLNEGTASTAIQTGKGIHEKNL